MDDELLKQALHDSPAFRTALKRAETQFEESLRQQESAIKVIRSAVEDGARMAELLPRVADSIKLLFATNQLDPTYHIIADYNVRSGMAKIAGSQILRELLTSRREEVDRVKGARRAYERALDRYESALAKHALGLKRSSDKRDPGSESGDLATIRRSYYQCMIELLEQLNGYKEKTNSYWAEKTISYFSILKEGECLLSHIYQFTDKLSCNNTTGNAPSISKSVRKDFMKKVDQEFNVSVSMSHRLAEKYGYLFKKRTKGIGPPWRLAYLSIENGLFRFWSLSSTNNAPNTNTSLASPVIVDDTDSSIDTNVLLCQIKLYDGFDRACCFEVSTPQRSYVFQALSEEDLMDWLRVFENSKNLAIRPTSQPDQYVIDEKTFDVPKELQLIEGLPEVMMKICDRLNASFVFACDYVLFDGKVGTLTANVQTITYFAPHNSALGLNDGCGRESVDWTEMEKYELQSGNLSSSIKIQLVNRKVDAPMGRLIQITFLDTKQHTHQASMFGELCKNLCGPRKANYTAEQLANFLYKRPGECEQSDSLVNPSVYPEGFVPPASIDFEPILNEYQDNDLDHLELDTTIATAAPDLFNELFMDPEGKLFKLLLTKRKNTEIMIGPIEEESEEGSGSCSGSGFTRQISYMIPLNNPIVKAKETKCQETIKVKIVRPHILYLINVTASTPDIMYGDAFVSQSRFVISFKTLGSCRLRSWFGMRWSRTVLVKSIIRAAAQKGFSEYCSDLKLIVKEELVKKKRPHQAPLEATTSEGSMEDLEEGISSSHSGISYSAYVFILTGILLAVYMLFTKSNAQSALNFKATGFKPLAINIDDIVKQAVKTEEAINRANYIGFLHKKLVDCSVHKGSDCRLFQEEWNRLIKD